ncbi:MAG: hypothetical protein EHM14_02375 [Methanothrix sp.]|nr:MAG: hypothetical protein EHM14_02375 [Methanothrix sp.]
MMPTNAIAVFCLLAATVMVLPLLSSVHAATISVGPDGGYAKVQEAVDAAEPGDIILVQNGTYRESVHVTRELLIIGIDRPVVDAMGNDNAFLIESDEMMLKGFVVLNSSDIGIKLLSDNNIIISNRVVDNDYAGIGLAGSNGNILSGNELINNSVYGVYLIDCAKNILNGNYVNKSGNSGFELIGSDWNYISENIIADNENDGIELKSSENNTINGNIALKNKDGICLEGDSKNNLVVQNNVTGNDIDGILLKASEQNVILGNCIKNNPKGIFLESSGKNLINNNKVCDNLVGIQLNKYSIDNVVYGNNLINNTNYNVYDESGINQWNIGSMGNCYSDYDRSANGCIDADDDKICDSSRLIPGGASRDEKPLRSN